MRTRAHLLLLSLLASVAALPAAAGADETAPAPPPPYSLPWQLRPAGAATVLRSDTSVGLYAPQGVDGSGTTVATTLLGSYKLTPELAPMIRLGFVSDSPPVGEAAAGLLNPVLGGTYVLGLSPNLRLALFLGLAIPLGSGGGNEPDLPTRGALSAGILTRSGMDNAMFATNYFTVFPGVGFAFVQGGFTVQAEITILELIRARGEDVDKDSARTNMTMGLHLGYFIVPMLSVGAELRYQRWLVNDTVLDDDAAVDAGRTDNLTFAIGPRLHVKLSDTMVFRPGISYARGLDEPMSDLGHNILQIDLPLQL